MQIKPDPTGESRNPLQVYLLALCVLSGLSAVSSSESTSNAIEDLNRHSQILWGMMISGGGFLALLGMYWQGDARVGLLTKRLGFVTLIIPCIIFGLAVLLIASWGGTTVVLTLWGFAVACYLRARTITKHIRLIITRTEMDESDNEQ